MVIKKALITECLYESSSKFFNAARVAAMTNALKVLFFPVIAFSTSAIKSFGKRIDFYVVSGTIGILNYIIT